MLHRDGNSQFRFDQSVHEPVASQHGFTLIELIFVIVVLGLVSALGSSFVVSTLAAYNDNTARSNIAQRGRISIEQLARRTRSAAPNTLRVSPTGNCLEFMPIVTGALYLSALPDSENGAPAITTINTGPYVLGGGSANFVLVSPFFASEVYSAGSPSVRATVGSLAPGSITLSAAHTFLRNSVTQRIYLADNPMRFCLIADQLFLYENYGFTTAALVDGDPGGDAILMSEGVGTLSQAFTLSAGSENRNTAVLIDLSFTHQTQTVGLNHEVLIRNVP